MCFIYLSGFIYIIINIFNLILLSYSKDCLVFIILFKIFILIFILNFLIIIFINKINFIKKKINYINNIECGFNQINNKHIPLFNNFFIILIIFLIFDLEFLLILPLIILIKNFN